MLKYLSLCYLFIVLGPDKKRLSKRHAATSLDAYKKDGYLNSAIINTLARLGWSKGNEEVFYMDDLIHAFRDAGLGAVADTIIFDIVCSINDLAHAFRNAGLDAVSTQNTTNVINHIICEAGQLETPLLLQTKQTKIETLKKVPMR